MEIVILTPETQKDIYPQVLEMLREADGDFVPPLSSRSSAAQQTLSETAPRSNGVQEYFSELQTQRFAAVYENGRVVAFVSWKEDYTCEYMKKLPNIYISTLIVRPQIRGKGVTTALYKKLFSHYKDRHIFTRTWSTNHAHIRVLEKYGFSLLQILPNHRGNGIDTVYFAKQPGKY